jgi:uncharacterized membrane protein
VVSHAHHCFACCDCYHIGYKYPSFSQTGAILTKTKKNRTGLQPQMRVKIILIVAFLGILLSLYSIPKHYATDSSSFCNISETFNCDKVNKSPWSIFLSIPVSILGLMSYLIVFYAALMRKRVQRQTGFTDKDFWQYFLYFTSFMLLFQIYLTMTEIFFIHAYCIVCLVSQVCTLALVYLVFREYKEA